MDINHLAVLVTVAPEQSFSPAARALHRAQPAIKELKDLHRGKLTLSANEYTVMYLLPVVPVFRARHPHIKVEVKRGLASRIPSEILGRDIEIGVVSYKPSDPALRSLLVVTDELAL